MSHIALLLPELEAGGAQRVMLLVARELAERGHCVDLVLLQASGALLTSVPEGVRLVDLGVRKPGAGQWVFFCLSLLRLARWIKRERPNALLSSITGANLVALLVRKMVHAPLRVVIREAVTLKNVGNGLRLAAMRWLYPQADAVIALSSFLAHELIDRVGVPSRNIHFIPNPVDKKFILEQASAPVSHPWLEDDNVRVVISVGRLIPQKDYPTLLQAFSLVPSDSHARLVVVGEGPERSVLEKLIIDLKIGDRVQLVGFDKNPWRWVSRADLFVLSSQWEGHPNALLEAVALGLPIIATKYDDSVCDMMEKCPISIVPVGQPEEMARAIYKGLDQKRFHVCEDIFSVHNAVDGYLAALLPILINSMNNDS